MNEKEKEVYEYLLEKIKEETDHDVCSCWCSALERFCEAVSTRILHCGSAE